MDPSGSVPTTGIPPPAPPPPPAVFGAPTALGIGRRSPAHRDNIGRLPTAKPTERPLPFAGVHPETLQHAAKRLRPTQHREPLFPREREQFLDGQDQLVVGRYWPDQPQHAPLAEYQTGTKVHASPNDSRQFASVGVNAGHSLSMSPTVVPSQQQHQPIPIPIPFSSSFSSFSSIPASRQIPIQLVGPLPGQTFSPGLIATPPAPAPSASPSSQLITDPKRYIHAYATQTPVATILEEADYRPTMMMNNNNNNNNSLRMNGTGAGSAKNNFFKELRDQGLSERQRAANQQQTPQYRAVAQPPSSLQNYAFKQQQTTSSSSSSTTSAPPPTDQVDQLIREMEWKMRTGYGAAGQDFCTKCRQQISGDPPGVTALGQAYHVTCFCCDQCQKQLAGCSFYSVDGKNLCQVDYMNSLEKCDKCKMPITQKILRALGKAFHPECFSCPACLKSLDGIPFTVDKENCAYCLDCYHERFSPRCAACLKVIAPSGSETEVARVIAMDRSYHLDCYKCEDCGLKLNSKIEGQGCYPLESHLFCKNCNLKRLKSLK